MTGIKTRYKEFLRDRRGFAAIELAFIAPVLLLIYFGVADLSDWYMKHRRLVVAGSTIADLVTQNPGQVTGQEINNFWTGIGLIIEPMPLDSLVLTIRDYRKEGGSSKRQWVYPAAPSSSSTPPPPRCGDERNAQQLLDLASNEMTDANDILIAEVCTTIEPMVLQVFGFEPVPMRYYISMRPRLGKTLDCTAGCS